MIKTLDVEVLGMTKYDVVGETTVGHNCDFDEEPAVRTVTYLHCVDRTFHNGAFLIRLSDETGVCGSGWTTADWAEADIQDYFRMPMTHKIKEKTIISIDIEGDDEYDIKYRIYKCSFADYNFGNAVFDYSYDGGDSYYPCGGYGVEEDLFEEFPRAMDKMPIWIFKGASGLGKSTIASIIGKQGDIPFRVYETDSDSKLPLIVANVIVVGNKYDFDIEDIKANTIDPENTKFIIVNFEEG